MVGRTDAKLSSKQAEIAARRVRVTEMVRRGERPVDIAKKLGVSIGTVTRDVKLLREDWQLDAERNMDGHQRAQLAKLLWAERMSQEAFEISQAPWREAYAEFKSQLHDLLLAEESDLRPVEETLDRLLQTRAGDPAFLRQYLEAVDHETKLLGLYGREQVDLTQTIRFDFSQLSRDEIDLLRAALELKRECDRAGVSWPPDSDRMRRFFEAEARGQGQIEYAIEVPAGEEGEEQTIGGDKT